jgi:hypothetical protein
MSVLTCEVHPNKRGTPAGYARHKKVKEAACPECTEAIRLYNEARRREAGVQPSTSAAPGSEIDHGADEAAYQRCRKRPEGACDPCKEQKRIASTAANRAAGMQPQTVAQCGTDGGYRKHLDVPEEACDRCKRAHADLNQQYQHAKVGTPAPPPEIQHGKDNANYQRCRRESENHPCPRCKKAHSKYQTDYNAKKKAAAAAK